MATNHSFHEVRENNVNLKVIETPAWNIIMGGLQQTQNLASGGFFGINGGFFGGAKKTYYMAINNNTPIYNMNQSGGWYNEMGRAALCYNNAGAHSLVWRSNAASGSQQAWIADGDDLYSIMSPYNRTRECKKIMCLIL